MYSCVVVFKTGFPALTTARSNVKNGLKEMGAKVRYECDILLLLRGKK